MTPKLGKKEVRLDSRTLRLAAYLAPELPPAPISCDYTSRVSRWPMMRNDEIGDCTIAGAGHAIQEWTACVGRGCVPTDADIVAAYERIAGYVPGDPLTDSGCVMLDVLKSWRNDGIAGHKILAFVKLESRNHREVEDAIHLFGNAYVGLSLPLSAKNQTVWSIPDGGLRWSGEPGTWGGHCVLLTGYDPRGLTCVTWGATKRLSWNFYDAYCDEAYALLSIDWFDEKGISPDNFKLSDLKRDLSRL